MSILLSTVVAGEQDVKSSNFDEEHCCTEDMTCGIWRDTN